jgi:uroporphyrinogen decarboxylase
MNSRERILAAIHLQQADRVPCSPHLAPATVLNMPAEEWRALLEETDVTMSVSALGDTQIFGGQALIDNTRTGRDGDTITTNIETPQGLLRSRQVRTPETSWLAEHMFKSLQDVDKALSIPYSPPAFDVTGYKEWVERIGDQGFVALGMPSAFRFCLDFFGSQELYLMMADDPDLVERLVATMNERLALYIEACCEKGVRSFWMGGSEHCGPGVVHPRLFRRMITPYDKRIVGIIHDYGGVVNLHTHGKLKDILDDILEIGVDVMSPIETGLRGDVTLAEVKARVGDRICLKGNLDDMAYLALEPADAVRAAAEDCIAQAAAGGGYILSGTDAGIYSSRWVESFLVMAEVAREHGYT